MANTRPVSATARSMPPGDVGQSRQEQVAKAVTLQPAFAEAVLEKLGDQVFVIRQRRDVVAQIAGRQHTQFPAQLARTAAIVGNGHNGGDVAGVRLQPAQHAGQAGSAADGDYFQPTLAAAVIVDHIDQRFRVVPMSGARIDRFSW